MKVWDWAPGAVGRGRRTLVTSGSALLSMYVKNFLATLVQVALHSSPLSHSLGRSVGLLVVVLNLSSFEACELVSWKLPSWVTHKLNCTNFLDFLEVLVLEWFRGRRTLVTSGSILQVLCHVSILLLCLGILFTLVMSAPIVQRQATLPPFTGIQAMLYLKKGTMVEFSLTFFVLKMPNPNFENFRMHRWLK